MEIEGKVILDLGVKSGTSKAGNPWRKREVVLETFGQYPRKVKVQVFGDRVDQISMEVGASYKFHVDVESREWNGNWFTDVSVFRTEEIGAPVPNQTAPGGDFGQNFPGGFPGGAAAPAAPQMDAFGGNDSDDLPF